jgi:hypothetical protein
MYLELSNRQFKILLDQYVQELDNTQDLHTLIMKLLKTYSKFDYCGFDDIKRYVDKQIYNEEN